ncbi:DUF1816 domain-containing protein [Alkalinema pantanalense CENA528]|uniref:DUF1816 domain-containing protein n=1 Tax=Alkalinema pantanalense TaxID=1620705 RepID=UPI003D6E7241
MKELLVSSMDFLGMAWWVEITTDSPRCTYYFGPFLTESEAKADQPGYIEDLEKEGAQVVGVEIKRCKPTNLTISDEPSPTVGNWSSAYTAS